MKFCKKCKITKSLSEFHNDQKRKDGKYPNCKECHYFYVRERYKTTDAKQKRQVLYAKNREKTEFIEANKKRGDKFYNSLEGRAKTLFNGIKSRQPDATVTYEQILNDMKNGICAVTRIPLDFDMKTYKEKTGRRSNPFSPSVDKINPNKGYTPENTRIVIWQYNMMKSELSDGEMYLICQAVVNNYDNLT